MTTLNYYLDHKNFETTSHTTDNGLGRDLKTIRIRLCKPNRDLESLCASF